MFTDVDTGNAYLFTFKFAVIATVLVNVISLILACALNSKIKFKNTIKAFYFLPYMLGSLIVGFISNKTQTSEFCRCLEYDKFSEKIF